jgi:predicted ArsR family transcriptional regulator
MKVLMMLYRFGQLHTSAIASRLNASHKLALRHLELLENETVVEHRLSGRIKYFRFSGSVKAQATLKLLEEWEGK